MKAIRLKTYQSVAQYKVESSFAFKQSYPLPPYSTILGMIHNMCGFKEYHDMKISVQGKSASKFVDCQTVYSFSTKGKKYEKDRTYYGVVDFHSDKTGITRGILNNELLVDVNLIIHIVPSEEDFDIVYEALKHPREVVSIGRYEDIAKIKEVKIVELEEREVDEELELKYDAYIPLKYIDNINTIATRYKISKKYEIINNHRRFNKVDVAYAKASDLILEDANILSDDKYVVFLA